MVLVNATRAWQRPGKAEHRVEEEGWGPGECHMGVKGGTRGDGVALTNPCQRRAQDAPFQILIPVKSPSQQKLLLKVFSSSEIYPDPQGDSFTSPHLN